MQIKDINKLYGGKLRVRACGVLVQNKKILLINHKIASSNLWIPPGGGVEIGESIQQTVQREFKEETSMEVAVEEFIQLTEYISPPIHAIELFYLVKHISGSAILGTDPENAAKDQLIEDINWFDLYHLDKIPNSEKHKILLSPEINSLLI